MMRCGVATADGIGQARGSGKYQFMRCAQHRAKGALHLPVAAPIDAPPPCPARALHTFQFLKGPLGEYKRVHRAVPMMLGSFRSRPVQ